MDTAATSEIQVSDEGIYRQQVIVANSFPITFSARDVRDSRTGIHAHVGIIYEAGVLEHDIFNTGRAEDRQRLVKKAHGMLPKDFKAIEGSLDSMTRAFSEFTIKLLQVWSRRFRPERLKGTRRSGGIIYQLKPFIVPQAGTVFFGPPGAGKSYLGLLMMQSIHMGLSTFWAVEKTPPLYVNLERSRESIAHRLALVNHILGLPEDTELPMLNARGQTIKTVEEGIRIAIREQGVSLLFYDSISRAGIGSLKEDDNANEIIDIFNGMGKTWGAIAHSPRGDASHQFGSVMLDAGEDIGVQIASENQTTKVGLLLQVRKANDIPTGIKEFYCMEFDPDVGLIGFRDSRSGEFPELMALDKKSILTKVVDYVAEVGQASATQISQELSLDRAQVSRILNDNPQFVRTKRDGHSQFYGLKASIS